MEIVKIVVGTFGGGGTQGPPGESAYQIWLDAGNTGTEADFLASLKGAKGDTGNTGSQGPQGNPGRSVQLFNQADEPTGGTYFPGDVWITPE